ncbi:MAG: MG2 domain-containing protein [Pseudomonadota bacterium]
MAQTPAPPRPARPRDPSRKRRQIKLILGAVLAVFLIAILGCAQVVICVPAWPRWGMIVHQCPAGKPRPQASLDADGLRRGQPGHVAVQAEGIYSLGAADDGYSAPLRRFRADLFLVDAAGAETRLKPEKRWKKEWKGRKGTYVRLPEVPDGDYTLRAKVGTPLGDLTVDAPLPIYAPAVVHLATDRPLYKPGQTMLFRAAALKMKDLAPLDGRPGTFTVTDPSGATLLEEKVAAGPWGVAAGDFPLADDAETGAYTITWRSGDASDSVTVQIEPFSLPRYEATVSALKPWFGRGDALILQGALRYRSGAPVSRAHVDLWVMAPAADPRSLTGDVWPPPNDWLDPHALTTDAEGAFRLDLGSVPQDLRGLVKLPVAVQATDATGERVQGGAVIVLSEHEVVAEVETELADGLVPDFNNRVYLRVSRPDGRPLPGAEVTVKRAWDPADDGVRGVADADAVAAIQLDPGQPVSVVIPPMPVRPRPPSEERRVFRTGLRDLFGPGGSASLDERVAVDRWDPALEPCALLVTSSSSTARLGVAVGRDGVIKRVVGDSSALAACLAERIARQRGPAGTERFFDASYRVEAAPGATVQVSVEGLPDTPATVHRALERARVEARPCVASMDEHATLPTRVHWRVQQGSTHPALDAVPHPTAAGPWTAAARSCVGRAFSSLVLDEPAPFDAEGVATVTVQPDPTLAPPEQGGGRVLTAYDLGVEVRVAGQPIGDTRVVLGPGAVPALRLRPEQPVLAAGDEVRVKLLRGPDFYGSLPDEDSEVHLMHGDDRVAKLAWDKDAKTLHGAVPEGVYGLLTVAWSGARAVLLVPRPAALAVAVTPDKGTYRPGEQAHLTVATTAGAQPTPAAVSLFGVDEALSQLAPLLSPDDWGRVTVTATVDREAFGRFDARALLTGRIGGENAVLATLQRISDIPATPAEAEAVSTSGAQPFDPVAPLTETFYALLSDARTRVAAWEAEAPEGELMTNARMVKLWHRMLSDRAGEGLPVDDAFGRRLELHRLPSDLLELCDPRLLVSDARRLPEDVENWSNFVWENQP